ncbi:hypothetical protein CD31A_1563 [Corynebacterium diphtheriae 31A]|nr:hypothetical protein CD31A_1563 [Corynebacterium diphtheriae 31A]
MYGDARRYQADKISTIRLKTPDFLEGFWIFEAIGQNFFNLKVFTIFAAKCIYIYA